MKKTILIIVLSIVFLSCSDSFLDLQPEDTLAPGVFFKTSADIKTGLVAAYQPLSSIFAYNGLPFIFEQMSDDGTQSYSSNPWNTFYKDNTYSGAGYWNAFYKIIVNANNITAYPFRSS
jgi:hypothetical protein